MSNKGYCEIRTEYGNSNERVLTANCKELCYVLIFKTVENYFTLHHIDMVTGIRLRDLTIMSEDEKFQYSLVWDYPVDMYSTESLMKQMKDLRYVQMVSSSTLREIYYES